MYKTNLGDTILIDKYLNNELMGKKWEKFLKRTEQDKNFRREIKLHLEVNNAIKNYIETTELLENLQKKNSHCTL